MSIFISKIYLNLFFMDILLIRINIVIILLFFLLINESLIRVIYYSFNVHFSNYLVSKILVDNIFSFFLLIFK